MRPVNEWIVVEKIKADDKTKGGIIIPEEAQEQNTKIQKSKVIKISQEVFDACRREKRDLPYKVGDTILHHSQTGLQLIPLDKDDKQLLLKFDAVMAVVEEG